MVPVFVSKGGHVVISIRTCSLHNELVDDLKGVRGAERYIVSIIGDCLFCKDIYFTLSE